MSLETLQPRRHGLAQRGAALADIGVFGRMFGELPAAAHADESLRLLARTMVARPEPPRDLGEPDEDENPAIPAGYTYLGQFVDHDITFDPASDLRRPQDPSALRSARTPRLDLDSLYGRGPAEQPYMYDPDDPALLLLGRHAGPRGAPFSGPDLPRNAPPQAGGRPRGRALIGDPRNDEHVIISQLHCAFIRFHNAVVGMLRADRSPGRLGGDEVFAEAQRIVRWHYQWIVAHDFLERTCGAAVVADVLRRAEYLVGAEVGAGGDLGAGAAASAARPRLLFYSPERGPVLPVEFTAAAFRFGHSMVRPSYFLSEQSRGTSGRIPIVGVGEGDLASLAGFRPLPYAAGVEWKFFFDGLGDRSADGRPLPQPSYRIDASLAWPLGSLPGSIAAPPASLAERNLLRGQRLGLPAGQRVARAMGLAPLSDEALGLTAEGLRGRLEAAGASAGHAEVERAAAELAGAAPLWYYLLREAEVQAGGRRLGQAGGRIVAEVIAGLLWADQGSFLRAEPGWRPEAERLPLPAARAGAFRMADLLRFAAGQRP